MFSLVNAHRTRQKSIERGEMLFKMNKRNKNPKKKEGEKTKERQQVPHMPRRTPKLSWQPFFKKNLDKYFWVHPCSALHRMETKHL